jgi:hypothetical protein
MLSVYVFEPYVFMCDFQQNRTLVFLKKISTINQFNHFATLIDWNFKINFT